MRLSCPLLVVVLQLLGLSLGDGLAPDVKQDLVVVHVSRKAGRPERDARPEAWRGQRVGQVRRGGGGREEGGEEEAVRRVERDRARYHGEVRLGAGGGAEGGYERAVEVVHEIEKGEDELGADVEGGAGEGEGGQREGCGRKRVKVGCEEEGERGDELHHDPGLDAINGEDAVGRSEPAKRRIVHKSSGADQSETAKEPVFGRCVSVICSQDVFVNCIYGIPAYR